MTMSVTSKKKKSSFLMAKLAVIGNGLPKEFPFEEGATVKDLLVKAGVSLSNKEGLTTKDGDSVGINDILEDGDVIYLSKNVDSAN